MIGNAKDATMIDAITMIAGHHSVFSITIMMVVTTMFANDMMTMMMVVMMTVIVIIANTRM